MPRFDYLFNFKTIATVAWLHSRGQNKSPPALEREDSL